MNPKDLSLASVLVRVKYEGGRVKYLQETDNDKSSISRLKQFVSAHEGLECYKAFIDKSALTFSTNLDNYYYGIMLNPLLEKCKGEYNITTAGELDAILSTFYLKRKGVKSDGKEYEVALRITDVPVDMKIKFIANVANFAIAKYQIKYPNANELDGLNK